MNFQQRLIKARKHIHFTGKEVADKAGITYQTYMNYENKGSLPSAENLIKISDVLNVSTDYLLKGDDSPNTQEKQLLEKISSSRNDIAPLIQAIKKLLLHDKNISFDGIRLNEKQKSDTYRDLQELESDILFGKSDREKAIAQLVNAANAMQNKINKTNQSDDGK